MRASSTCAFAARAAQCVRVESLTTSRSRGIGVRVLGQRAWGFACTPSLDPVHVSAAAGRAAAIAATSSAVASHEIIFDVRPAQRGSYATPVERLATLDRAVRLIGEGDDGKRIRSANAQMEWRRMHKRLVTTEGTDVSQDFVKGACNMQAIAQDDAGATRTGSYPTWSGAHAFQGGYERIARLDLAGDRGWRARRWRSSARRLAPMPSSI